MTTVPGFNHLIQQSGLVREKNQSTNTLNPEPAHATAEQVSNEQAKKTIVQKSEQSEKTKSRKDKEKKDQEKEKKRKMKQESEEENNPDSTGRLLDTIV
ncbi:MAG: hypothetical protein K8R67_17570 [Desulfobacteraceae bacterium]|nr:hypothetical protein [Desulfobacteraceae bacterium]